MAKVKLIAIAAVSVDGVIGIGNTIPWNIPEDYKHFRKTTIDNTLIVGSTTFHTLPEKALENRNYLVLNGGDKFEYNRPNVKQFSSSEELLALIEENPHEFTDNNTIYVIGGAGIYNSLINKCDEAIITWVGKSYPYGDKKFPIDRIFNDFELYRDEDWHRSTNGMLFKVCTYHRNHLNN